VIFAGLEPLLQALGSLKFSPADLDYLQQLNFRRDYLDYLETFHFAADVSP